MTTDEMKRWIDGASYAMLLEKWRFAPIGDPFFQGEVGDYYTAKMREKKQAVGGADHVETSKELGWERT